MTPSQKRFKKGPDLWRVCWTHARSGDVLLAAAWDRETAEYVRDNFVDPLGMCIDVHLVPAGPLSDEERHILEEGGKGG